MLIRILVTALFSVLSSVSFAQIQAIQGFVLDKQTGKPIPSASVLLKSSDNKIQAFERTDTKGFFSFKNKGVDSKIFLEINHLGYKKYRNELNEVKENLHIELDTNVTLLDSILVKSKPAIQQHGDTLVYNVGSFANGMDRSIGDVLKKMPGIEVSDNGSIKYQGQAISNLYIDSDDLLDDRYAIGTKTIPHKMVEDVQVLRNHEPLKVLKDKRLSDAVALNLVIKEEAKLKMTGEIKIGAGLPKLYDAQVNSILFNKKFKLLNVLQGNNIGKDLAGDFVGFNRASILAKLGKTPINNLLSLGTVGAPPLGKTNYFFNNHGSINANNLVNLKDDWQLKSNIQLLLGNDRNHFEGEDIYLTESEKFTLQEIQDRKSEDFITSFRFTATKNTANQYISNNLNLEYSWESSRANIYSNHAGNKGILDEKIKGFSNQLFYVPKTNSDHIIQLDWYLDYGNKPQTLRLNPGVFADKLNNGIDYDLSKQFVEVPTLYTRATLGYRIPTTRIRQNYQMGAVLDKQRFNSSIIRESFGILHPISGDSLKNNMDWKRYNISVEAQYDWSKNRFSMQLNLPLELQITRYADPIFNINKKQENLLLMPSLNSKLLISDEDELNLTLQGSKSFGNIDNVYRGIVLRNYRSLSNNIANLAEHENRSASLEYKFARTKKMVFMNAGLSYTQTISSNMVSNQISDNSSTMQLIDRENQVQTFSSNIGLDKFIFKWASSLKLNAQWSVSDYYQLFNQELLSYKQYNYSIRTNIESKVYKSINLSYHGSLSWSQNKQENSDGDLDQNSFGLSQTIGLPLYFNSIYLRMNARHLYNKQDGFDDINYLFLDAFARYRIKKWNSDLELSLTNLANIKTFDTYMINANMQSHNQYQLRGRMAVLKYIFNFK
ncbi:carboxypeptidase-like regulatory domain-containing protein [Sphingobacterium daejeonense]|uniref:carboxypeptidase-like regulatory domain-containing protein n=1 Tax=Sphingobacterium daejeonense TaxID=371142 RepID=UPI0021A5BB94|nr:carboxypeptidase-like regulatory domain-containing protein [Sphingobacterium daejeonense]MCT1530639.1 carboxypeptidase-like regulatory domain-containing protein [Sphingobacterium daejeonense]